MKELLNRLFPLGLLLASPAWASQQVVETIDKSYTVDGTPEIDVRNVDGPITITAHQGSDVRVKAIKEVHKAASDADAKRAADKVKVEIQQVGNRIEITADYPKNTFSFGGGPYANVRFEILAPKKSNVDAHAVDGSIEVSGLEGRLQLKTVDGDLEVRSCLGEISAHTVDGDLRLENVGGTIEARTTDGDLRVDGALQALQVETTDGDLVVRVQPGSKMEREWSIESTDGDIRLTLPEDFAANLEIRANDGEITTQFPVTVQKVSEGRFSGELNGGGHRLSIRSSDGDIRLMN